MISSLLATALWLQLASYFGWPVSTTHAIIGALIGFGALIGGIESVHWLEVGRIALSWVISPVISGFFAFLIFSALQKKVLFAMNPIRASKRIIPVFTFILLIIFMLSVMINGLGSFHYKIGPLEVVVFAIFIGGIGSIVSILLIKRLKLPKAQAMSHSGNLSQQVVSLNKARKHLNRIKLSSKGEKREEINKILKEVEEYAEAVREESGFYTKSNDYQVVEKLFAGLQILSASYVAFAHGANDVANAIGPVAAALQILKTHALTFPSHISPALLALGGVGIVIGLATWGWRVMETIGRKITELTPTRGFSAEFGAAVTILIASKFGLPISSTICIVGAVLGVGLARGISALNLRVLRDIVLSWVITLPTSAILSILIFYLVRFIFS